MLIAARCPALQRLADKAERYIEQPGNLAVLIAIDIAGQPRRYVTAGRRDLARTAALDKGALYQIGSQTKTLVAWALLLLERDGQIRLDDPVVRHVDLPIDPRITVRHLLLNASGLGEYTSLVGTSFLDVGLALQPRDLLSLALPEGQLFTPGERVEYCNTGWLVAAMLLDAVTGSYAEFVRDRIFEPLRLENSFVGAAGFPYDRAAHGYVRTARGGKPFSTSGEANFTWAYGAGDIVSCCDDMLDLFAALRDPANATGVSLSDLVLEAPPGRRGAAQTVGTEYAYGLERRFWAGRPVWGHHGRTFGYGASSWVDLDAGVTVTTCTTWLLDLTEPQRADLRDPGPHLFTLALATGYSLAGL